MWILILISLLINSAILLFLISIFIWYFKPSILIDLYMRYALYQTGLNVKFIIIGKYQYAYIEKGEPVPNSPSMIMVHGFSSSKETWLTIIRQFPENIHIIAVDLLGHGDSSIPEDSDNNVDFLIYDFTRFVDAVGLANSKIHLIGHSFGGPIIARYACIRSENVKLLTLISSGMNTPEKTDFMREIETNRSKNALLPKTIEDLELLLSQAIFSDLKINKQILKGYLQQKEARLDVHEKLFNDIMAELNMKAKNDSYLDDLKKIESKIQVLWGKNDNIVHLSGIEVLQKFLPQINNIQIFERCGHLVTVDRPDLLFKALIEFRNGHFGCSTNGMIKKSL